MRRVTFTYQGAHSLEKKSGSLQMTVCLGDLEIVLQHRALGYLSQVRTPLFEMAQESVNDLLNGHVNFVGLRNRSLFDNDHYRGRAFHLQAGKLCSRLDIKCGGNDEPERSQQIVSPSMPSPTGAFER